MNENVVELAIRHPPDNTVVVAPPQLAVTVRSAALHLLVVLNSCSEMVALPAGPVAPVGPAGPVAPVAPVFPCGPGTVLSAPVGPTGP